MVRQRHADQEGGNHVIFQPEYEEVSRYVNGMVQEYDAAIILLEFARSHPNLTVVPAPFQSEHTNRRRNVDFVVVDVVGRQAVGAQVKTKARRETVRGADQQRVVFVDGTTDLGNVKVVRVDATSSRERVRPWPGIIAAKRVENMPSHGKSLTRAGVHPSSIQHPKEQAQELVGTIRVDYADLATKIGHRILAKL